MNGRVLGLLYAGADAGDARELLRLLVAATFADRPVSLLVLGAPDATREEEMGEECEALLLALRRTGAPVERRASAEVRQADWHGVVALHRVAPRNRPRVPQLVARTGGHPPSAEDLARAGQVVFSAPS